MANGGSADVVGHFQAGWDAVRRYPVVLVPLLLGQVAVFAVGLVLVGGAAGLMAALAMGGEPPGGLLGILGFVGGGLLFGLVALLVNLLSSAVVVIMARDALAGREPSLRGALDLALDRLGAIVAASVLVTLIVVAGFFFLVLPGLVAGLLLVFTMPAVLLDGDDALAALRRSARVVAGNLGPVLGVAVGAVVLAVAFAVASSLLNVIPVLGALASFVLGGAFVAYLTVVGIRLYQSLPRAERA
jgi:hypothetical protein